MDSPIGGILTGRRDMGGGRREIFLLYLSLSPTAMADERKGGKSQSITG
jgi:hypothetical protein